MKNFHIISIFNMVDNDIHEYNEYFTCEHDAFEYQDILNSMGVFSIYSIKTENCH